MDTRKLGYPLSSDDSNPTITHVQDFDLTTRIVDLPWAFQQLEEEFGEARLKRNAIGTLTLLIIEQDIEVMVDLHRLTYAGRPHPYSEHYNGIDFSPFDAHRLGVSRRHMALFCHDESIVIFDNKSTNGTYLNQQMLAPHMAYRLQHDDAVRLGAFKFIVKFD